jgi:hypothetical protein
VNFILATVMVFELSDYTNQCEGTTLGVRVPLLNTTLGSRAVFGTKIGNLSLVNEKLILIIYIIYAI